MNSLLIFAIAIAINQLANADQKRCKDIKAIPLENPPFARKTWHVARMYQKEKPKIGPGSGWRRWRKPKVYNCGVETNYCSVFHYGNGCETIIEVINLKPTGEQRVNSFAYSKHTGNVIHYVENFKSTDPGFNIVQGELLSMECIGKDKKVTPLSINDKVKSAHSKEFAIIAVNETHDYVIQMTCDRKTAWLLVSEDIVRNGKLNEFISEIEKKVNDMRYFKFEDFLPVTSLHQVPGFNIRVVDNAQTECTDLVAIPLKDAPVGVEVWHVARVYQKSKPQIDVTKNNYCSLINYADGCGAIVTVGHMKENGDESVSSSVYNKHTKNTVYYKEKYQAVNSKFKVVQGEITSMTYIDNAGNLTSELIPVELKTLQHAWLMFAEHVVRNKKMDNFEDEIEKKVNELGYFKYEDFLPISMNANIADRDQKKCTNLEALQLSRIPLARKGNLTWRVARIYQKYKPHTDITRNYCSIVNYEHGCEAIVMFKSTKRNGDEVSTTLAYNKNTDTVAFYKEKFDLIDEDYAILRRRKASMAYIDKTKAVTPVDEIPEEIEYLQSQEFAFVATNEMNDYVISMTCDKKFAWLMFPDYIIIDGKVDKFTAEIEKKVDRMGYFKFKDFEPVPLDIPSEIVSSHFEVVSGASRVQTACLGLKALPLIEVESLPDEKTWYVAKVVPKKQRPQIDQNVNYCGIFNYTDDCEGIKLKVKKRQYVSEIGTSAYLEVVKDLHPWLQTVNTYAYNKNTGDIVHYEEEFKINDNGFSIFQGKLTKMGIYNTDGLYDEVNLIDYKISEVQSQEFAIIASNSAMDGYMLAMTCDKKFAWVMFSEEATKNNELIKAYEKEIKVKINKLNLFGFKKHLHLKSIHLKIPEDRIR